MKCNNCNSLISIDGFGGPSHYLLTKKSMDNNVNSKYFTVIEVNNYETVYQCIRCGTKWALAEPDFPVTGYFVEKS